MPSNELEMLRRKELIGTLAWLAWALAVVVALVLDDILVSDDTSLICYFVAWVLTTIWVAMDAGLRRMGRFGWTLLTLVAGPAGFGLYYYVRKSVPPVCSRCGSLRAAASLACPACGHASVLDRARGALLGIYIGLGNSLVRGPVDTARETAKHVSFALGAFVVIGLYLVSAPGLLGAARTPFAVIWALSTAAYWVLVAWWVYLDSSWRRMDGVPWAVLTLVTNVVGLVTYLVIRYPDPRSCPGCRSSIPTGQKYCPFCGAEAEPMCPHCQSPTKPGWQFCAVCAARLTPVASENAESSREPTASGITITGSVLDAVEATPITGARVQIDAMGDTVFVTTDSLGRFSLSGLEQRPLVLVASANGYLPQAKAYSPGETPRNLCFGLYIG